VAEKTLIFIDEAATIAAGESAYERWEQKKQFLVPPRYAQNLYSDDPNTFYDVWASRPNWGQLLLYHVEKQFSHTRDL
jgi:hypothetical protein